MMSRFGWSAGEVNVLDAKGVLRVSTSKYPILALADRSAPKLSVLVRYAFAMGRKRLPDIDAAIEATEGVLRKMLPKMLGEIAEAGASVEMRVAYSPDQPRDDQGQWTSGGAMVSTEQIESRFPRASAVVDGRTVRDKIPNQSSIDGISDDVEVLPGVREVQLSDFDPEYTGRSYSASEERWIDALAEEIRGSNEIDPLIIVIDNERYPYILEGGHRFDALIRLKAKSFPAKVVIDRSLLRTMRAALSLRTARTTKIDKKTQAARAWAEDHAAELIKGLSKTTRERVKAAIAEFVDRPSKMAPALRAALGDADRAEMIARTESMRAAHKGQQLLWQEAQSDGLLGEKARRVWIVTEDEAACPICLALDGKTAPLDDAYDGGAEYFDGPPAHPSCRCTEGIA